MNLLVAHDGSEQSDKALAAAYQLAGKLGAAITVLTVVPDLCLSSEEVSINECNLITKSLYTDAQAALQRAVDKGADKAVKIEVLIKEGHPVDQIIAAAAETKADFIVLGAHGKHGGGKYLLGSVSSKVAMHSNGNVIIIK